MKTLEKAHVKKIKKLQDSIALIEQKYPGINFTNMAFLNEVDNHRAMTKKLIYTQVDLKGCQEQKFKCEGCICRSEKN